MGVNQRKIDGRNLGRELLTLVGTEDWADRDFREGVLEAIAPPEPTPEPKAKETAKANVARLGRTLFGFGKHCGRCFDEVALPYLHWLCGAQEDFYRDLRQYLRHPDLARHRRAAGSPDWEYEEDA